VSGVQPTKSVEVTLAVNSRVGRSQDQLHIHVDWLKPSVRLARRQHASVHGRLDTLEVLAGGCSLLRPEEPEEIADIVAFLSSAKASYITGVNITMDEARSPVVV